MSDFLWQLPTHQSNLTNADYVHPKAKLHCFYKKESLCKKHSQDDFFEKYDLEEHIKEYGVKSICSICLKKLQNEKCTDFKKAIKEDKHKDEN